MTGNTHLSRFSTFTILVVPLLWLFETSAIAPALGAIGEAFPEATDFQLRLVLAMPFVSVFIFSIISGIISKYFDKKHIMIVGLILYGITGILPAFADDVETILMLRFVTGIGVGLVLPVTNSIITEHFSGATRNKFLSYATGVANFGNVAISVIVGGLLVFGWQVSFYAFSIVFIILLLVILGTPNSPPSKKIKPEAGLEYVEGKPPKIILWLALFMLFNWTVFSILPMNIAIFITMENLGEPWVIGLVIALPALASIASAVMLSEAQKILGRFLVFAAFLIFSAGFYLAASAHSITPLVAGALLVGLGSGFITPIVLHLTADRVATTHIDFAFGVITSCIHLGAFASPFTQELISAAGSTSSIRFLFLSGSFITATAAIIALLHAVRRQKAGEVRH